MKSFLKNLLSLSFIAFFSVFYATKLFNKNLLFYGEEKGFINYDYVNYRFTSIWDWTTNFGKISADIFNRFTLGTIWGIGRFLRLDLHQIEWTFYFVIIFITFLFAYLVFFRLCKNRYLALVLGLALITSYNYYATLITTPKILHYLVLTSSIFFFLKYTDSRKPKYLLINTLFQVFLLSIAANPPQMIGAYSFILVFAMIFSFSRKEFKTSLNFLFPYFINVLIVFFANFLVVYGSGHLVSVDLFARPSLITSASRLRDIYRFFGGWWDYQEANGILYNHLSNYYYSFFGKALSFIPVLIFFFLLTRSREKSSVFKLSLLYIIFLFFSKGSTPPFAEFYNFLYKIPILKIFREPWAKFIPNYILAVLLGIAFLIKKESKIFLFIAAGALTVLVVFQSIPLYQGKVIDHSNPPGIDWKLTDVDIPRDWIDLNNWSKKNLQDKRILILPFSLNKEMRLTHLWEPIIFKAAPEYYLLYSNIISSGANSEEEEIYLKEFFGQLNPNLITMNSIDFVLFENDILERGESEDLTNIGSALDLKNKITFGKLELYPVKKEYKGLKLRAVAKIIETDETCDFDILNSAQNWKNTITVKKNSDLRDLKIGEAKLNIERINEGVYRFTFPEKVKNDVGLFFSEAYNNGWHLKGVEDKYHYPGNCFGNFWIIKKNIVNDQRVFYLQLRPYSLFKQITIGYFVLLILYLCCNLL